MPRETSGATSPSRRDDPRSSVTGGRQGFSTTKQTRLQVASALSRLHPRALAGDLATEIARIDRAYGDSAFEISRREVCTHEASHAIAAGHEGIAVKRIEIFRETEFGRAGEITIKKASHVVTIDSHPEADLRWARYIVSGYVGALLDPSGREGHGLDECVLARRITDVAAVKMGVDDAGELFRTSVRARMRRILKANWPLVVELSRKLENDGSAVDNRWLRSLLSRVRHIDDGGAP